MSEDLGSEFETGPAPRTMTLPRRRVKALLAISIVAVVLAAGVGCLTLPPVRDAIKGRFVDTFTAEAGSTVQRTPTDVATPGRSTQPIPAEPIDGDLNGDGRVDAWEKDQLERYSYTLKDGTKVKLDPNVPLPDSVLDEVKAKLTPYMNVVKAGGNDQDVAWSKFYTVLHQIEAKVGRTFVPVVYVNGSWGVASPAPGKSGFSDADAASTYAREWINGRASYQALIFD